MRHLRGAGPDGICHPAAEPIVQPPDGRAHRWSDPGRVALWSGICTMRMASGICVTRSIPRNQTPAIDQFHDFDLGTCSLRLLFVVFGHPQPLNSGLVTICVPSTATSTSARKRSKAAKQAMVRIDACSSHFPHKCSSSA